MPLNRKVIVLLGMAVLLSSRAWASEPSQAPVSVTLTPAQLFDFAEAARVRGDLGSAEAALRALSGNPDIELRTEARFRLGMMLADQRRYADAAIEFRKILDEKPKAARVRLELARVQALMGHVASAERELRAAEAAGLPPEVERMVRFFQSALSAAKPFGFSLEASLAPDTNINRATRSDTLGTIIGDFTLDEDAKAKSGIGLDLRGQAWGRVPLSGTASILARASVSADLYRESRFNDAILALQAGPELRSGRDTITLLGGPAWRWYGAAPYTRTLSASASLRHPLGKRAQLRLEGGAGRVTNLRNTLQTGWSYSASLGYDRALSARTGAGVQLSAQRDTARDPGYALASGGASVYLFRELGKSTLTASLGYNHLEADARLFLYPNRRIDNRVSASLAATFRSLRIGPLAPLARVRWERNRSTLEIYDYRRVSGEVGITAAF